MRRALALLALAWTGCNDVTVCPWISNIDGFSVVLEDEQWSPARYTLEIAYTDRAGAYSFRCDVPVPLIAWDGALDGGSPAGVGADAGVGAHTLIECTPLTPTGRRATVQVGKALVLACEGTPASATLRVLRDGQEVLAQELALTYQHEYPYGRACGGPTSGAVSLQLP